MNELEAYQQDYPDKYHSLRVEINNAAPGPRLPPARSGHAAEAGAPLYDTARRRLKKALAELDVSVLLLAANQDVGELPRRPGNE
jgi:hypothetical protein